MNGKKMSKSDGNTISPEELFSGQSPHVSKGYSPMVVRFFMLQSHYSSTMDLTDEALQAAEKGFKRIQEGEKILASLETTGAGNSEDGDILKNLEAMVLDMDDDFNTPKAISRLFELVTKINSYKQGSLDVNMISKDTLAKLKSTMPEFIDQVLGLKVEGGENTNDVSDGLMELILELRQSARKNKDWATSDKIRDSLNAGL